MEREREINNQRKREIHAKRQRVMRVMKNKPIISSVEKERYR